MNDQQLLRYSRHILLDQIGIEGQEKLLAAHVVVIGAGGLGSPAALYLASAGVGKISIVDDDNVDLTNLQRQILHTTERVGSAKVSSAQIALAQINSEIQVVAIKERLQGERLKEIVKTATVVLDCSDNFQTRHAVNQACVEFSVPLVSGAAISFDGQISVFDRRQANTPCYACLFPIESEFEDVQCSTMGVFSPLVGIIGCMQAAEALKLIMQIGNPLVGRLLLLDALQMEWNTISISRHESCSVCGSR